MFCWYTESFKVTVTFVPVDKKTKNRLVRMTELLYINDYQNNASLALSANSQKEQI